MLRRNQKNRPGYLQKFNACKSNTCRIKVNKEEKEYEDMIKNFKKMSSINKNKIIKTFNEINDNGVIKGFNEINKSNNKDQIKGFNEINKKSMSLTEQFLSKVNNNTTPKDLIIIMGNLVKGKFNNVNDLLPKLYFRELLDLHDFQKFLLVNYLQEKNQTVKDIENEIEKLDPSFLTRKFNKLIANSFNKKYGKYNGLKSARDLINLSSGFQVGSLIHALHILFFMGGNKDLIEDMMGGL